VSSALLAAAQPASARELDLRKTADPEGVYSLNFCARPFPDSGLSIPPHAYIAWSQLFPTGKRSYKAVGTVTGVQPRALLGFATSVNPVPPEISQPIYTSLSERCLTLIVSKADYQRTMRLGQASLAQIDSAMPTQPVSAVYSLPPDECVNMFSAVMKSFADRGIGLPKRGGNEPPLAYLRRLVEINNSDRSAR